MRHLGFAAAAALALAACGEEDTTAARTDSAPETPAPAAGPSESAASIAALSVAEGATSGPEGGIDVEEEIARLEEARRAELGLSEPEEPTGATTEEQAGGAPDEQAETTTEERPEVGGSEQAGLAEESAPAAQPAEDGAGALASGQQAEQTPLAEGMRVTEEPSSPAAPDMDGGREEAEADIRNRNEGYIGQTAAQDALPTTEMSVDSEDPGDIARVNPETTPMVSPSGEEEDGLLPNAEDAETVDTRPQVERRAFISSDADSETEAQGRKAADEAEAQRRATAESAGAAGGQRADEEERFADTGGRQDVEGSEQVPTDPVELGSTGGAPDAASAEETEAAAEEGTQEGTSVFTDSSGAEDDAQETEPAEVSDAGSSGQAEPPAGDEVAMTEQAPRGEVGRLESPAQTPGEMAAAGQAPAGATGGRTGGAEAGATAGGGDQAVAQSMQAALDALKSINGGLDRLEDEAAESAPVQEMREELQTAAEALIRAAQGAGVSLEALAEQ